MPAGAAHRPAEEELPCAGFSGPVSQRPSVISKLARLRRFALPARRGASLKRKRFGMPAAMVGDPIACSFVEVVELLTNAGLICRANCPQHRFLSEQTEVGTGKCKAKQSKATSGCRVQY